MACVYVVGQAYSERLAPVVPCRTILVSSSYRKWGGKPEWALADTSKVRVCFAVIQWLRVSVSACCWHVGRVEPIPLVVKEDNMGLGRFQMEVRLFCACWERKG